MFLSHINLSTVHYILFSLELKNDNTIMLMYQIFCVSYIFKIFSNWLTYLIFRQAIK